MLLPVPTKVPPQLPRYHFQTAPVPSEPPFTVSTTDAPVMIEVEEALIEVAAVLGVLIVSVNVAVLSQPAAFVVTKV
jgi:hypothetical protein